EGRGVAAQAIAHASETPTLPSQRAGGAIDPQLEATIVACLAKRPEDRPRSARAILAMLEGVHATWTSHDAETWWAAHAESLVAARGAERVARADLARATGDPAVAPASGPPNGARAAS